MRFVVPDRLGDFLQWKGQRRACVVAQGLDAFERFHATRDKTRPQTGQVGAFGQRVENDHAVGVCAHIARHLQRADRRGVSIDLAITFVGKDLEIVFFGQGDQTFPIIAICDGALWVGRGTDVGKYGAFEHIFGQNFEVRKVARFLCRVREDRFGRDRNRGYQVDLIEWVRHQDDGFVTVLGFRTQRHAGVVEPLARAIERHDL